VFSLSRLTSLFAGQKHNLILELNENGQVVRSLHDPNGSTISDVSEIHDEGDALWFGSYKSNFIGKLDLKD